MPSSATRSTGCSFAILASALLTQPGCLLGKDAYEDRKEWLRGDQPVPTTPTTPPTTPTPTAPTTSTTPPTTPTTPPDAPGILVRLVDADGRPASGKTVVVGGIAYPTDLSGLAWIPADSLTVVAVDVAETAPTGAAVFPFDGYTGVTLELVPLMHSTLPHGTINEAGVRSIAFPPGSVATGAEASYAWADENAPPTDKFEIYRAVYVAFDDAADWVAPAVWRVASRGPGNADLCYEPIELYRFDTASGEWTLTDGQVDCPDDSAWIEAEIGPQGGWFALASPPASMVCLEARPTEKGSGDLLPGTEVRVLRPGRDAPLRVVADEGGVACLPGQVGVVDLSVLRGADDGGDQTAWFVSAKPETLVSGQYLDFSVVPVFDDDGDGALGATEWDCDDNDPYFGPGAVDDWYTPADENCDGTKGTDGDGDGFTVQDGDCNDNDAASAPDLEEECDGVDNDCNAIIDDQVELTVEPGCLPCRAQTIADLGPIWYFPLDDVDTYNAADWSGWGRDLSVTGDLVHRSPGVAQWDAGTPDWYGDIGSFLWLEDTDRVWPANQLSVSMWVRPAYANRVEISYQSNRAPHDDLYDEYSDDYEGCDPDEINLWEFTLFSKASETRVLSSDLHADFLGVVLPTREWTHVVFVRDENGLDVDGDQPVLYINGGDAIHSDDLGFACTADDGAELLVDPAPMGSGGVLRIGQSMTAYPVDLGGAADPGGADAGDNSGTRAFDGLLDEVAIFDRALTPDEVQTLFRVTTCDEGVECDLDDQDADLSTDEHLLGTYEECPAVGVDACADITANGSEVGTGPYWVNLGSEVFEAWCEDGVLSYCGDGVRSDLADVAAQESCDPRDPSTFPLLAKGCDGCVADMPQYVDCQDVLDHDSNAHDGAYRVDFDGPGPYPPVSVRCDMDAATLEGWTLVFAHDTSAGVLFNDPNDEKGQCARKETSCTDGVTNDADADVDCADSECWTDPACIATSGVLPEALLCPDPRDGIADAYCGCVCPEKAKDENIACLGPLGSKFSVVAYLDAFQEDGSELVQYKMRWPFHERIAQPGSAEAEPLQWCQEWLPTEVPPRRDEGWCFDPKPNGNVSDGFAGLAPHGVDPDCSPTKDYQFAAFDGIEEDAPSDDDKCSEFFAVGLARGNEFQACYGMPSNASHLSDGTSKAVELWVRRVRTGTECPNPCEPP